jgi:4-hydroxy-3-methylbut-2-enyl diphosphate reductase
MTVLRAKRAGFCFGVRRAVDMSFRAAKKSRGVFTLGPIIHNPQVIERLAAQGVRPTEDIEDEHIRMLIVRTHGVPEGVSKRLAEKGYEVIDATCPFVKKAQQYAKILTQEGYQVVIIGDEKHPEVQGLMSYAGADRVVVQKGDVLPALKSRVGVVVQTTQPVSVLKAFMAEAVERVKELKVFNTICNSTALRLKETEEMARKVDVMVVVGGRNSANTSQLAKLCLAMGVPTYHIETASEIRPEWFSGARSVGITAGASTPDWIIREVEERIRDRGGKG